jgi:pimeloyl-ACP methyl ester carboxylesterase
MADLYYSLYPHGLPSDSLRLLDGTRLHYRTSEAGQIPVILVHGFGLSSVVWEKSQILISPRYRSFAPDLRGFGLSDKTESGYGCADLADDLSHFMKALKIRQAVLVGHGFGGRIVQHFALEHPDRVLGLILVNSGAGHLPQPELPDTLQRWLNGSDSREDDAAMLRDIVPRLFDAANASTEDLEHFVEVGLMASTTAMKETIRLLRTVTPLTPERYQTLKMPVLIIIGSRGPFKAFDHAVALSDVMTKSRIVVMARCGHSPMWEKPIEFVKAITDFLGENGIK